MKIVGPRTKTKSARTKASTMLVLDSHWMPFSTPDTAEKMKQMVSTTMISTSTVLVTSSAQPTILAPEAICSAPRPSEVAEPKSVAKMAKMSMTLPTGPLTWRLPMSGSKTALIVRPRPLRKTP